MHAIKLVIIVKPGTQKMLKMQMTLENAKPATMEFICREMDPATPTHPRTAKPTTSLTISAPNAQKITQLTKKDSAI